jgi:hypothetical protein
MKRPIGAGFRFWRFRLRSAVLRPRAVGSGQLGHWLIWSPLAQIVPYFHRPRQLCYSLELLHSMKVQSCPPHGEPPSRAPILLNPDGSASAAIAYPSPARGQKPSAWQALVRCVALAASKRAWMLLKPPSALAPGLSRRLHTSAVPGNGLSQKPNKTGGSVRFLRRAVFATLRHSCRKDERQRSAKIVGVQPRPRKPVFIGRQLAPASNPIISRA